jgi:hypothetical protein
LKRIREIAVGTNRFYFGSALPAKIHTLGIFSLAFRAFHFSILIGEKILMKLIVPEPKL